MIEKRKLDSQVVEIEKRNYTNPLVIAGFEGSTFAGVLSASYIIESMQLHQVAHVISQHIPPVTVFVGGKLRHPFRIYSNGNGTLVLIVCEVPIPSSYIYEISNSLMNWLEDVGASDIVLLEGTPVNGLPEDRSVYSVAEKGRLDKFIKNGIPVAESALIAGMGGGILNECLVRKMSGASLITAASTDIPDPGSVLSLVEAINKVYNLKIKTDILEKQVNEMNDQLKKISEQYQQIQEKTSKEPQSMYG